MDVGTFLAIGLALIPLFVLGFQRLRDRRKDRDIAAELSEIKTALITGTRPPSVAHVEQLISGVVERKKDEATQREFDAMRDLAVESYSQLRESQRVIRNLLEEKTTWQAELTARDAEVSRLKRDALASMDRITRNKDIEIERVNKDYLLQIQVLTENHKKEMDIEKNEHQRDVTQLTRVINRLKADVSALEHTITRLSAADDSGPVDVP